MPHEAETGKYRQYGPIVAECLEAGCDFRMRTKTSPQAVVKRHVEETGHEVEVRRAQYKRVRPADA